MFHVRAPVPLHDLLALLDNPVGRIEVGAGYGALEVAQEAPDVGALPAQLAGGFPASGFELADVVGHLAFLLALGALHAPLQAGQAAGDPLLAVVGGAELRAHALHQRGQVGGVFAQRHQRLFAHLGVIPVAQVGGAGALLAFGGGGAVRLPPVAPVRLQILLGHGLLDECHIEAPLGYGIRDKGYGIRDKGHEIRDTGISKAFVYRGNAEGQAHTRAIHPPGEPPAHPGTAALLNR